MECAWLGVERRALPRGRGPIIGGAGYMCCIIMKEASLSLSPNIYLLSQGWSCRCPGYVVHVESKQFLLS